MLLTDCCTLPAGCAESADWRLQVRHELQRLPGAPTQTSRLFALRSQAAELKQKAADMKAKAVPRPDPPHYAPLWQNVHRFLGGLGSQERMTNLLVRLMVTRAAWHWSFVYFLCLFRYTS